jgi:uncharacterized protein YdeI (YjbR/CyaY-like superfamily)
MKKQRFAAVLEKGDNGLGWTVARVPFVPQAVWPEMVRLRVQGTVNGFAFRTSLFPYREGGAFYLLVNRAMLAGGQAALGGRAEFVLEPDMEPRPAELPEELDGLLDEEEGLRAFYESFSESMRREMGKWIGGVKSDEARQRRGQEMAERLLGAMEGERELPPVVAAAFRRRPKAKAGWEKLSVLRRRQELLAVYYYKTPESRAKRVEKLCDLAEGKA